MINLSIIIPYFNAALLLQKLLDTIPQTPDIEVIVIDDQSTENQDIYHSIMYSPKYTNVRFYKNTSPHKGPGASRNMGIEKAQGKWVLFADADDFFLKDFCRHITPYFTSNEDVVFFTPTSIDLETGEQGERHLYFEKHLKNYLQEPSLKNELNLRYETVSPWSKMIQREFLIKNHILFDPVLAYEDNVFSVKSGFFMRQFSISPKIIYCITHNKESITANKSAKYLDLQINAYIRRARFLKENLPKNHLEMLTLRGQSFILKKLKFGLKNALKTFILFKKNKISPFNPWFWNPCYLIYRILKKLVKK